MKKSAFTLIELLVVISIIAILASIALPVFGGVMERSRATNCASNLKQLGLGVAAYLNDNDEQMFSTDTKDADGNYWVGILQAKYVTNWKVFKSPFDKRDSNDPKTLPVSYGINEKVLTQPGKPNWDGNVSKLIAPSQLILMAPSLTPKPGPLDKTSFKGTSIPAQPTTGNGLSLAQATGTKLGTHQSRSQINVLFADNHAASLKYGSTQDKESFADTNSDPAGVQRWLPLGK